MAESGIILDETLVASSAPSAVACTMGERCVLAHRYEIQALLGAGGMGTVYRARDTELDEAVALKVLRHELADAPGMLERFRREVKLARRVTHRNVARVFDIGEHQGDKFLTMELVEGEALSAMLAREGRLGVARASALALDVAEGLGSAHAAGVIHRDLKPDNVMIGKDGRVVITDFGIARVAAEVAGPTPTMGALVGTPAYMAPEQVEGHAVIDARADVYAFGALLYELYTGVRAWPGESPFAVASARLLAPPPDPRAVCPSLPDACAELVMCCMARRPEDRPASLAQVIEALAGLSQRPVSVVPEPPSAAPEVPAAGRGDKTVAVLPFRNAGPPDDDYLAEELTDDLIDAVSMTRGLKVQARGVVARFRGAEQDPRDVGRALGVQVVVEGSVRRARGQVRVSARLISVADGFQLWAKRFDQPEQNVLSINDEVARAVAGALTLNSTAATREAPSDPRAVDRYLRARHEFRKYWPENVERAIELYRGALAAAPGDPMILSGLAIARVRVSFFKDNDFVEARRVAEQAVAVAPELGEAHLALGQVAFHTGDPVAAMRSLRHAMARSPGLADAHAAIGRILIETGPPEDGIQRLMTAITLDPETPNARADVGRAYALLGQWDKADAEFEKLREHDDAFAYGTARARTALWRGDVKLAISYLDAMIEGGHTARVPLALLQLFAALKTPLDIADRIAALPPSTRGGPRRRVFFDQMRAEVLSFMGDVPHALAALEHAMNDGLIDRVWLERCPSLEEVRRAPGYAALHEELRRRSEEVIAVYRGG